VGADEPGAGTLAPMERAVAGASPLLSLIVPAHDAATFIHANLREIIGALEPLGDSVEVIVVCDGCGDATAVEAARLDDPRVRVLQYERNEGKGYAICHGASHARGRLIGWLDADLDISPQVIVDAVQRFETSKIDAVIGSKRHPESEVAYPLRRRFLSAGFQLLVRVLFRINVRDTQVGAKVFRCEMLRTVLPLLLIKRYAFDLEVLAVGAEFGFDRIVEAPIDLDYRFTGSGIDQHAVRRMFQDTLAIAYRIHLRHWYVRRFAALERERADANIRIETQVAARPGADRAEILSVQR
jgi:glycosyltransferase involved in cell wall biosynthesis